MGVDEKATVDPGSFPPPTEDESGLVLSVDWTKEEEARAKRK